jgi:hypothetical protein
MGEAQVRRVQMGPSEEGTLQMCSLQARLLQVHLLRRGVPEVDDAKPCIGAESPLAGVGAPAEHRQGSLYIRRRISDGFCSIACVLADECAKHFNDRGFVVVGIPHNSFKGVNSAQSQAEVLGVFASQLIDRFAESVSDLTLFS